MSRGSIAAALTVPVLSPGLGPAGCPLPASAWLTGEAERQSLGSGEVPPLLPVPHVCCGPADWGGGAAVTGEWGGAASAACSPCLLGPVSVGRSLRLFSR